MATKSPQPIKLFYCYAREDQILRDKLHRRLEVLHKLGLITSWYDGKIDPGIPWKEEIKAQLDTADIILLLISADSLSSPYWYDEEMRHAIERHQNGEAVVIPIILRDTPFWEDTPFGRLQALPTDATPIDHKKWHSPDEAFKDVAHGIRVVIDKLIAQQLSTSHSSRVTTSTQQLPSSPLPSEQQQQELQTNEKQIEVPTSQYLDDTSPDDIIIKLNQLSDQQEQWSSTLCQANNNTDKSSPNQIISDPMSQELSQEEQTSNVVPEALPIEMVSPPIQAQPVTTSIPLLQYLGLLITSGNLPNFTVNRISYFRVAVISGIFCLLSGFIFMGGVVIAIGVCVGGYVNIIGIKALCKEGRISWIIAMMCVFIMRLVLTLIFKQDPNLWIFIADILFIESILLLVSSFDVRKILNDIYFKNTVHRN